MGNLLSYFKPKNKFQELRGGGDNLLLTNIQEQLEEHSSKVTVIGNNMSDIKSNYFSMVKDIRNEMADLKKNISNLEKRNDEVEKSYRNLSLINQTQETKINELENKLIGMETADLFLDESIDITQSSRYMDSSSRINS